MQRLNLGGRAPRRLSSVLGLTIEGGRIEGAVLRRSNGSAQVAQSFTGTLSLDPLTAAPELVGRELRNQLDAAGIRERHCVFGLPLKWALITQADIPDLPPGDVESFLALEAERNFPCELATLLVCTSKAGPLKKGAPGYATMIGIPRNHLATLEKILRAAKLKPVSFMPGIAALQPAEGTGAEGVLALALGPADASLQVTAGEGIVALRSIEGIYENRGGTKALLPENISREVRITLGQLPAELRERVRALRVFGPRDLAQQTADELELRFEAQGLKIEAVQGYGSELGVKLPAGLAVATPVSLAARALTGGARGLEFLPPKVSPWKQTLTRYGTGKLRVAGAAAVFLLLIIGIMFGWQQFQLIRLESQWKSMSARVKELEQIQGKVRQFRPWHDERLTGLSLLRELTLAFPEDGAVSAKTIEIRDLNNVTCSGVARDNTSWLKTFEKLQATPAIADLKVDTVRGKAPLQFTFNFRWNDRP